MYYRNAKAAVVVFDVTNQETFRKAKEWVEEFEKITLKQNEQD